MFPPIPTFQTSRLVVVAARPAMGLTRFLCALANVRLSEHPVLIHSLQYSDKQIQNKLNESSSGQEFQTIILDTAPLSYSDLEKSTRDIVAVHGVKTIIIDHLNLLKGIDSADILPALKSLAEELNVEIVASVLVNRRPESHSDNKVALSDIPFTSTGAIDEFIPLHHPLNLSLC